MPRLYLPIPRIIDDQISITGEKAHYLVSVLRCKVGNELTIFDGEGNCLRTEITKSGKKEVVAEVLEKSPCDLESPLNVVLAQGLLKGEKMDVVVQKATELGVKEIVPIITERSQLRETRRTARWRKIAEEAARQSGRALVPIVHEPVNFEKFLELPSTDRGFIFYEEGGISLRAAIDKMQDAGYGIRKTEHHASNPVNILIGSEGGFTVREVALAKEKGLIVTSLGNRILRAETAAISAVALIQFLLGDMG